MTKATHNDRGWSLCLNRYVLASKAMRLPTNFRQSIYLSKVFPSPCPFRTLSRQNFPNQRIFHSKDTGLGSTFHIKS